jgi:hypothetical protein
VTNRAAGLAIRLRSYLIARAVLGGIAAILDTIVLVALGIPSALLWGVLSFLMSFVPNVGFIISMIPPALLGLVVGGLPTAILVVVAYSVINVTVDYLVQPRFIGSAVDLSPVVVTVSLLFWALILGGAGAIFAVPLTIIVVGVADSFDGTRPLSRMLAANVPALLDEATTKADAAAAACVARLTGPRRPGPAAAERQLSPGPALPATGRPPRALRRRRRPPAWHGRRSARELMRTSEGPARIERDDRPDPGAHARKRIDGEVAAEHVDAVGEVHQARPRADPAGIEPDAGIVHRERDLVRIADQADPDGGRGPAVLDGVLERLEAAEVDGSLEPRLVAAEPDGFDRDLARRVVRDGPERLDHAVAQEQPRAAVAGDIADLGERGVQLPPDPLDRLAILGGFRGLGEQAEVDPRAHEPLLGAVMEIAGDPLPLHVDRVEGPDAGPPQVSLEVADLDAEPDRAGDADGERQQHERGPREHDQQRDREGDEGNGRNEQQAPEARDGPAEREQAARNDFYVTRAGPPAVEHPSSRVPHGPEGRRTGRGEGRPPDLTEPFYGERRGDRILGIGAEPVIPG